MHEPKPRWTENRTQHFHEPPVVCSLPCSVPVGRDGAREERPRPAEARGRVLMLSESTFTKKLTVVIRASQGGEARML